ncbi:MAG: DUF3726 domain-containing protein [Boseongicola sp.]|nr:DUF3726 domain-containing protein [Boseongicola sp.]
MSFSLNEVEATAKKAARGAGYPWGLADEAGKATRWLEAHGMAGCTRLAAHLQTVDSADLESWTPNTATEVWESPSGHLCPIITGSALSDAAYRLRGGPITLNQVHTPHLLLSFIAGCSNFLDQAISLTSGNAKALIYLKEMSIDGSLGDEPCDVTIGLAGQDPKPSELLTRASPDLHDWAILNRFAKRTYAPATAASRAKGAGAGLTDND